MKSVGQRSFGKTYREENAMMRASPLSIWTLQDNPSLWTVVIAYSDVAESVRSPGSSSYRYIRRDTERIQNVCRGRHVTHTQSPESLPQDLVEWVWDRGNTGIHLGVETGGRKGGTEDGYGMLVRWSEEGGSCGRMDARGARGRS